MIVFPMAGRSARFRKAGYGADKFMLEAHGRTLFAFAVGGFAERIGRESILFVHRGGADTRAFIDRECARLGFASDDYAAVALETPTRGQAETVALGLEVAGADADAPLTIFNIDSFRPGFRHPPVANERGVDGYLEIFRGEGDQWSFVRLAADGTAAEVAEKRRISDLCSTGLYHFRRAGDFLDAFHRERVKDADALSGGELYVAPLYNLLIADGKAIGHHEIPREDVIFCGVPAEYEAFVAAPCPFFPPDFRVD